MLSNIQIATLLRIPNIKKKKVLDYIINNSFLSIDSNDMYDIIRSFKINITKDQFWNYVNKSNAELEKSIKENIQIVGFNDDNFPKLLKIINDAPVLLYYKGDISCLNDYPTVAVIGTRNPSKYGEDMGRRVGEYLAENEFTVVSGLAIGCDSAAHRGCISRNGKTVAILAHGLQKIYPSKNQGLAENILNQGGCLVSEYIYGSELQKHYFIERNRLQSGSSYATVVIETSGKGGSMKTVDFTLKQNRYLYCINHPKAKQSDMSVGNQILIINNKAIPITGKKDIDNLIDNIRIKFNSNEYKNTFPGEINENQITLTIEELSLRLNRAISTIKGLKRRKNYFRKWSKDRDPEQYEWEYDSKNKLFYVIPDDKLKLF